MKQILSINDIKIIYLLVLLILITGILMVIVIIYIVKLNKIKNDFSIFMNKDQMNLEELMKLNILKINKMDEKCNEMYKNNFEIHSRIENCINKVSIHRYKAFADVGSDLSFSLAMLDSKNNGIIITGIYGREDRAIYAKPIDGGMCRYNLSKEEDIVLKDAMIKYK